MSNEKLNTAFIALGSNKGDKLNYLYLALNKLVEDKNCIIEKVSSIYETKPYGVKEQQNFLNSVIKIKTNYNLVDLFHLLKKVEKEIGRKKEKRWGPREIDLDLIFFNNEIYSDKNVTVPHKGILERDFVLIPLCEIEPEFFHPEINKKICDICNNQIEKNIIRKIPFQNNLKKMVKD